MRYGIQGGRGSFNEDALFHYLQQKVAEYHPTEQHTIEYLYTTSKVLSALRQGSIDYGLFAVYNSVGGPVNESVQTFDEQSSWHSICRVSEFSIPIRHCLMVQHGVNITQINTIMTHPQVLKQCAKTLQTGYTHLKLTSGCGDLVNTAGAAQALAQGELPPSTAVIGSERLSTIYGLTVVAKDLQDEQNNQTYFWLVARQAN